MYQLKRLGTIALLYFQQVMFMPVITSVLAFFAVWLFCLSVKEAWDAVSTRLTADQLRQAEALAMNSEVVVRYLRLWGAALLLTIALVGFLGKMWLLAIAIVGILLLTPRWIFHWAIVRRRQLLRDQMVGCCIAMSNTARAGQSLMEGMKSICKETPEPLSLELQRIVAEYEHGRTLPDALQEAKVRLNLDSFTIFASTIITSLQRGGRITVALEKISRSLEENQRIERKLAAETASGWRVVLILTAFPFLFLAAFYVLYPEGTLLMFHSIIGQFLLMVILGLIVLSVYWSRQILSIDL
jgi:tight adherence protein B